LRSARFWGRRRPKGCNKQKTVGKVKFARQKQTIKPAGNNAQTTTKVIIAEQHKVVMAERHNEYGDGVEDLVRRSDAEYWQGRREEEEKNAAELHVMGGGGRFGSGSEESEEEDWGGEIDLNDPMTGNRKNRKGGRGAKEPKKKAVKRAGKTETNNELRERIAEKSRLKDIKEGLKFGRMMRKEGKMKAINTYFAKKVTK
jgi:hypothetical protein